QELLAQVLPVVRLGDENPREVHHRAHQERILIGRVVNSARWRQRHLKRGLLHLVQDGVELLQRGHLATPPAARACPPSAWRDARPLIAETPPRRRACRVRSACAETVPRRAPPRRRASPSASASPLPSSAARWCREAPQAARR